MNSFKRTNKKSTRGMLILRILGLIVVSTIVSLLLVSPIYFLENDIDLLILIFTFPVNLIPSPYNLLGLLLLPLGLIIIAWANYALLHIGKIGLKDREPMHRPSALVVVGPYKFTRNPIYFGVLLMLIGLGIVWSSLLIFLGVVLIFLIFRYIFIKREEIILEEAFSEKYLDFKKRVRRWI